MDGDWSPMIYYIMYVHTQGFWDLVSIQVDDMNQKFKNLEELERNDWKQQHQVQPTMHKKRGKVC